MPTSFRRSGASAIVLGAVLLLTACSGGDKAVVDEITVDAASLELSGADEKLLGEHFVIAPRAGDEAGTLAVLTALGLDGVDAPRTIDGSTATYTDWRAVDGSSEVTAERVVFSGLHMTDTGAATFDAVQISDMKAVDFEDIEKLDEQGELQTERRQTVDARLSELVLISPTPELAMDISELLRGVDDASDETVGDITRDMDFRAMRVADFRADVSDEMADGTVSVGQVVIGKNERDEQLDIVVEAIDFDWTLGDAAGPAAGTTSLTMDGMTALGVNTASLEGASGSGAPGALAGLMNPGANMPYRSVDLGTVSYQSNQFDIAMAGFEATSEGSGNVLTMRSVLQPMEFTIKDATATPLAPHMAALEANGLSTVTLKGSATSEVDRRADRVRYTDAQFEIDGGLRADCDYSVVGTMAAAKSLRDSGVEQPDFSTAQTNEDISRLIEQMEAYSEAQRAANANVKIESGTCVIQDVEANSLVTRGYAVASEVMGRPVAVLKASAQGLIAMTSLAAPDPYQRGMADTVGSGLIEFLGEPGKTMTITLSPSEPVPMSALRGDNSVEFDALGISVTVE